MSSSAIQESLPASQKSEKKHKREKSEHKKKRAREEEDDPAPVESTPRKSKKPKSDGSDNDSDAQKASSPSKKKKSKKDKRVKEEAPATQPEPELAADDDEAPKERKKSKKHKKHHGEEQDDTEQKVSSSKREKHKDKRSKKDKKKHEVADEDMMDLDTADVAVQSGDEATEKKKRKKEKSKDKKKRDATPEPSDRGAEVDTMDIDVPEAATTTKAANIPSDPSFPFFKQTTSIYVPFFPVGFDKPLTNVAAQHLDPLLNHYSPLLKGVLLKYSNLNLSDRPVRASLTNPPTDKTPALLHSIDEYAVGFGWLTFDAHIFKPSRGKWMEGVLQLQSEGHIGVVCWNKFNASIEAKRLPKGWKWVDLDKSSGKVNGSGSLPSPAWDGQETPDKQSELGDLLDGEELQVVEQIHSTGYWVNDQGRKVTGKLRFRIKNFDIGLAGDYGYLSIEGTFLDGEAERAVAAEERETERRRRSRQNPNGLLRPLSKRVPEFSVTKLGKEEQEEDSGQRIVFDKGSRPGTPDDN